MLYLVLKCLTNRLGINVPKTKSRQIYLKICKLVDFKMLCMNLKLLF